MKKNPAPVLACIFLLLINLSGLAQVEFVKPSVLEKSNHYVTLEKVTVKPSSITFTLEFDGGKLWRTNYNCAIFAFFRGAPYISIPGQKYNYQLTDASPRSGVAAYSYYPYSAPGTTMKAIKHNTLTAEFPFNSRMMFLQMFNMRNTNFDNILSLDFLECSNKSAPKSFGCQNFVGVLLPFSDMQLHTLYLQNFVEDKLKKGEFETTSDFQQRTHPDSLLNAMLLRFENLEALLLEQAGNRMLKNKPSLVYDADLERFTVTFNGQATAPVQIHVPRQEAESFKLAVQNGTLTFSGPTLLRKKDGSVEVAEINVYDRQGRKSTYKNLVLPTSTSGWKKEYQQEILKVLNKLYSKNRPWAELK